MTRYEELMKKELEDLTPEEEKYMTDIEIAYYRDRVDQLRKTDISDYKISAYLHDLYEDYIIFDDVPLADAYGISDDNWEKALDYYWNDMFEENPLMD